DAYTAALKHQPDFLLAYVNRGLARLELKQYESALTDFNRALELGRDDAFLHTGRGVALEGMGRHKEADRAFRIAFAKGEKAADPVLTQIRWVYGFAVTARLPGEARKVFDEVLKADPQHPQALYGRAMLAVEAGQPSEALKFFKRALDAHPGFIDARR